MNFFVRSPTDSFKKLQNIFASNYSQEAQITPKNCYSKYSAVKESQTTTEKNGSVIPGKWLEEPLIIIAGNG